MPMFQNLSSNDLGLLALLISLSLSYDKTIDEKEILGDFLITVGTIISLLASQDSYLKSLNSPTTSGAENSKIKEINLQLVQLQKNLETMLDRTSPPGSTTPEVTEQEADLL